MLIFHMILSCLEKTSFIETSGILLMKGSLDAEITNRKELQTQQNSSLGIKKKWPSSNRKKATDRDLNTNELSNLPGNFNKKINVVCLSINRTEREFYLLGKLHNSAQKSRARGNKGSSDDEHSPVPPASQS